MREATNDTFGKGIDEARLGLFGPPRWIGYPFVHKLGFSTAFRPSPIADLRNWWKINS